MKALSVSPGAKAATASSLIATVMASLVASGVVSFQVGKIATDPSARADPYTRTMAATDHKKLKGSFTEGLRVISSRMDREVDQLWESVNSIDERYTFLRTSMSNAEKKLELRHSAIMSALVTMSETKAD